MGSILIEALTFYGMEAKYINPDQTAPWDQSDLGPYSFQYRPPKYISRKGSRRQWP